MRLIDADALKEEFANHEDRKGYLIGDWEDFIDNAPTVEYPEAITIKCDTEEDKQKLLSALRNARLEVHVEEERPQGEPVIKCKDCKYQVKEWRVNRRMKEKGYWAYGCKHFGEIMGYWGFGGDDNEFCSDAEIKEAENDNP